jgi:poly(3-hydroxybutyrate) depolymerase
MRRCLALAAALVAALASSAGAAEPAPPPAAPLPALAIDPRAITVSGVSSGGYLAHALHVARSATISGAAVLAAGPYFCAGDGYPWNLFRTLKICADLPPFIPFFGPPDPADSSAEIRVQADRGGIDDPRNLGDDPVFLVSGGRDRFVPRAIGDAVETLYGAFVAPERIESVHLAPAAHGMISAGFGIACGDFGRPFVNDCGYDAAGALLAHLYGPLEPPAAAVGPPAAFDQAAFVDAGRIHGLAATGRIYVPQTCAAAGGCRLHVALHGCLQSVEAVGEAFVAGAGYNRWAETNRIVVLYPQAARLTTRRLGIAWPWPNPFGCWDWWGFTGEDYHLKSGAQIAAIAAMIDRLRER